MTEDSTQAVPLTAATLRGMDERHFPTDDYRGDRPHRANHKTGSIPFCRTCRTAWPCDARRLLDAARTAMTYEQRVDQMAVALHRDCELEWDAIAVVDPGRALTMHFFDAHYGQAHDLVRRVFPELAAQPEDTRTADPGGLVDRIAREAHAKGYTDSAHVRYINVDEGPGGGSYERFDYEVCPHLDCTEARALTPSPTAPDPNEVVGGRRGGARQGTFYTPSPAAPERCEDCGHPPAHHLGAVRPLGAGIVTRDNTKAIPLTATQRIRRQLGERFGRWDATDPVMVALDEIDAARTADPGVPLDLRERNRMYPHRHEPIGACRICAALDRLAHTADRGRTDDTDE